jgi:flavin reductase (NADH)/flavin reductase
MSTGLAPGVAAHGLSRDGTRDCARRLASGVSVVTTRDLDGQPYGLTMSAVLCVSLDPSLFLASIADTSETLAPLLRRAAFVINVLGAGQQALADTFASKGRCDKFLHVAYGLSAGHRLPVLWGALAAIECRLVDALAAADHRLLLGEGRTMRVRPGSPLLRYDGDYRRIAPAGLA